MAMTTRVIAQAMAATNAEKIEPIMPAPRARRKARKAMAQAIGWRTMTFVRLSAVSREAVEKWVPSISDMTTAGLYPM